MVDFLRWGITVKKQFDTFLEGIFGYKMKVKIDTFQHLNPSGFEPVGNCKHFHRNYFF